ncbi:FkbM family methyltransferase [Rhizobium sp. SG_E_25_P2]|uniref:FkbM family methyltransferase n=1 Tax=Rhizobium sp. SG_E_25_P2 TaxID=2879942 RepID=UPI00247355E1|nr:FkbM family methyltransferase [Rhizobium sp. SG_E_25_P2]MDH6266315.1 FkbM family methyltransferase [Rhizobium sp. SG_E_25_P2]
MNGWKKLWAKTRDRWATRFFDTSTGRRLLIHGIGPRAISMTVDCGDHVMTFSPSDYIGRKIFRKGHYDRDHVARLMEILADEGVKTVDGVLLELGGNIGTHTVYFALEKQFFRIVTVEPDPRNFALLSLNVAQNRLAGDVTALNCAAGERAGILDFFQNPDNHGRSGMIRRSAKDVQISVPVKPVIDLLAEAGIPEQDVVLVWADIEGFEPVAFRSMEPLLRRRVPIHTEFTPELYGPEESARFRDWLGEFYEDCWVFIDDGRQRMKVMDIPISERQFDLLLLP